MRDEQADAFVAAIKRDTLKLFPEKRIPYCVWCRETLDPNNFSAWCSVCDSLFGLRHSLQTRNRIMHYPNKTRVFHINPETGDRHVGSVIYRTTDGFHRLKWDDANPDPSYFNTERVFKPEQLEVISTPNEPFGEGFNVLVSGHISNEEGRPLVRNLYAQVATVYDRSHEDYQYFKVWPLEDDPQLPEGHNGKLWFHRDDDTTEVIVISDSEGALLPKKVYLDDVRDTPKGWIRAYCPQEIIAHLETGWVSHLSLDHDLGDGGCPECGLKSGYFHGYTVLTWLEEQVVTRGFAPPKHIAVHSDNASAREKMLRAIAAIHKRAKAWVE